MLEYWKREVGLCFFLEKKNWTLLLPFKRKLPFPFFHFPSPLLPNVGRPYKEEKRRERNEGRKEREERKKEGEDEGKTCELPWCEALARKLLLQVNVYRIL